MKIDLDLYGHEFWPRCFYDRDKRCGDPQTRGLASPSDFDRNLVERHWHIADMCDCPSCPLRCAIRDAMASYKEQV